MICGLRKLHLLTVITMYASASALRYDMCTTRVFWHDLFNSSLDLTVDTLNITGDQLPISCSCRISNNNSQHVRVHNDYQQRMHFSQRYRYECSRNISGKYCQHSDWDMRLNCKYSATPPRCLTWRSQKLRYTYYFSEYDLHFGHEILQAEIKIEEIDYSGYTTYFFRDFMGPSFIAVSPEPDESGLLKVECGQNGLRAAPAQHTILLPSVTTVPPIQSSHTEDTTDELTEYEVITGALFIAALMSTPIVGCCLLYCCLTICRKSNRLRTSRTVTTTQSAVLDPSAYSSDSDPQAMQMEPLAVDNQPPSYVAAISDGMITMNNDLNNQPIQAGKVAEGDDLELPTYDAALRNKTNSPPSYFS